MKIERKIVKYNNKIFQKVNDVVAGEQPITIYLNGEEVVTLFVHPSIYRILLLGF